MENIKAKRSIESVLASDCTGCYACMNCCHKDAISMIEDERGFSHPVINHDLCVNCGACYDICPVNKEVSQSMCFTPTSYSLTASPEISSCSSSGGAFSILANEILKRGGIVFGARSNGLEHVWHEETDNIEGLDILRRSKYFQSDIGFSYRKVKKYLVDEKEVLFVGTPCQIAGLKNYLRKDYQNLYTCDLICHGVPSKMVFRRFVKELEEKKHAKLLRYYRDSSQWAPCIFSSEYTRCLNAHQLYSRKPAAINEKSIESWKEVYPYDKDWFNLLFHSNLIQRRSCRHCRFCKVPRVGEITLGDDWRYYSRHISDTDKLRLGRSFVIVNNKKGESLFKIATKAVEDIQPAGYTEGPHINVAPVENPLSEKFFEDIRKRKVTEAMWDYTTKKTLRVNCFLYMLHLKLNTKNKIKNITKKFFQ